MITTLHGVIRHLSARSSSIDSDRLLASNPDQELFPDFPDMYNLAGDLEVLDEVATTAHALTASLGLPRDKLHAILNPLFKKRTFYGAYHELRAYGWLNRAGIEYEPQPQVAAGELLKQGGGPADLDGRFVHADVYFDIKSFGFEHHLKEMFNKELVDVLEAEIVIDGSMDNAISDISVAFQQIPAIARQLRESGRARIDELDWEITTCRPNERVRSEITWHNPYRLAEANGYYPLAYAKQFTCSQAFVLIFAFDHAFNGPLHVNFADHADILFRSICRRSFVQSHGDCRPVADLGGGICRGIDENLTVSDVAHLLSAVLFVNVQNQRSWLYTNPNATYSISQHRIYEMFDFDLPRELHLDNFAHDNY